MSDGSVEANPAFRTSLIWEGVRAHLCLDVQSAAVRGLFKKIEAHAFEAAKQGKDFALGPLHHCVEGTMIDGQFLKMRVDYKFLEPGEEAPADWTVYRTSTGCLVENSGRP